KAGFGPAVELPLSAGAVLLLAAQGCLQALLDEALADALDGGAADLDRLGDPLVGPGRAAGGGGRLEQGAGGGKLAGGALAGRDQVGQLLAVLVSERNLVLLDGVPPGATTPGEPLQLHSASQKWRTTSHSTADGRRGQSFDLAILLSPSARERCRRDPLLAWLRGEPFYGGRPASARAEVLSPEGAAEAPAPTCAGLPAR